MDFGFINVNKPKTFSSFDVIRKLRGITGIRKMGHAGTLDPIAEGVLVVGISEATKFIDYIQAGKKEYIAEMVFGVKSNTFDAEGEIEEVGSQKPSKSEIEDVLTEFIGEIDQVPPAFSALKINGKRAYELARKGEKVEMKSRKVQMDSIELLSYKYPILKIKVNCGKGTYIRSLCNDVGEKLEVGAYMKNLIRTKVGDFDIDDAVTLEEIEKNGLKKYIVSLEQAFIGFPKIELTKEEYEDLSYGRFIKNDKIENSIDIFAGFAENRFVGMLEKANKASGNLIKFKKKVNYG